jgi:apolipoprotein N-acyltransferase
VQFLLAGMVFHLSLLQWLLAHVYWVGGWALVGWGLLSLYLALYWAVLGASLSLLKRRLPYLSVWISMPVLWCAMEWLQATLFSGFGWSAVGYSQGRDGLLIQWAALGGVGVISGATVALNGLLATAWSAEKRRWLPLAGAVALLAVLYLGGASMQGIVKHRTFQVGILQSNFSVEMRHDAEYALPMVENAVEKSRWLALEKGADLIVWPEALVMRDIQSPGIHDAVTSIGRDLGTPLFTGSHRQDYAAGGKPLNSSYLLDDRGTIVDYYDKMHLAPFGEYVPFADTLPFLKSAVPVEGGIGAGQEAKVMPLGERRMGPLICFEVLFAPMAQHLRAQGADFLTVITNLGWFGASSALPQELEIARFRAVETRLPLVHAANTGISGVFDPWGRFTGLDTYVRDAGDYVPLRPEISPHDTRGLRMMGVLPVPPAAEHPFPAGPKFFPLVMLVLAGLLFIAAATRRAAKAPDA